MKNDPALYCSFCKKSQHEVEKLVAGPDKIFICNECVVTSFNIIKQPPPSAEIIRLREAAHAIHQKDYKTALRLLQSLAEHENARAQFWLGQMHEFGQGIPKDLREAFKWYHKAADKREIWNNGCSPQHTIGTMYKAGSGVLQNDEQAYFWYLLAEKLHSIPVDPDKYFEQRLTSEQFAKVEQKVKKWLEDHPIQTSEQ